MSNPHLLSLTHACIRTQWSMSWMHINIVTTLFFNINSGIQIGIGRDILPHKMCELYLHSFVCVCVCETEWDWKREHLKRYHIYLTMLECVVVRINLFPLSAESRGETPALTALSTITCSHSHTQDLYPLIYTVSLTNTHTNNNLSSYLLKTKHFFPP